METYVVRGEEYRVICGVHNKIIQLVSNSNADEDTKKYIIELVDVANKMAVSMENALERKRDFGIGLFGFHEEDNND